MILIFEDRHFSIVTFYRSVLVLTLFYKRCVYCFLNEHLYSLRTFSHSWFVSFIPVCTLTGFPFGLTSYYIFPLLYF